MRKYSFYFKAMMLLCVVCTMVGVASIITHASVIGGVCGVVFGFIFGFVGLMAPENEMYSKEYKRRNNYL